MLADFPACQSLVAKLGPCEQGKCCLYLRSLGDVDAGVLEALIRASVAHVRENLHRP